MEILILQLEEKFSHLDKICTAKYRTIKVTSLWHNSSKENSYPEQKAFLQNSNIPP